MFDIGFWELCLVGLVGLLVVGPERLPGVARLAGFWLGKAQRTIASVKREIAEELRTEEIKQALSQNSQATEVRALIEDTANAMGSIHLEKTPSPRHEESVTTESDSKAKRS